MSDSSPSSGYPSAGEGLLRKLTDVGKSETHQSVLAARHLSDHALLAASIGVNQAKSRASCVGSHSPSTGTTYARLTEC